MHRKLGKIGDLSISTSFMLNKLQKQAFRTIFSNTCYFSRTFGSLSKCSQFKSFLYCFGKCSFEPTEHIPLPNSWGWSPHYSDRFCDFFFRIFRYYKDVYVISFSPGTARLWNLCALV